MRKQFVLGYAICVISATKFRSMDAQVLFRSFRAKITQSHTAITSIAIRVANQLRIRRESAPNRHCENRVAIRGNPQKINPHEVRNLIKVFATFCFCKK